MKKFKQVLCPTLKAVGKCVLPVVLSLAACALLAADEAAAPAEDGALPPAATRTVDFARELQPLFAERCYDCHGEKKQESGLRADNRADLLKGGDNGPSIVISNSAESILVQVLADTHPNLMGMPKKKDPFTDEQIGLVRAWIDQGGTWLAPGPQTPDPRFNTNHWAFKAPVRPTVPAAKDKQWPRTPVDNFVAARLDAEKLKPSPEADKITLLRRLSLDLVGLPPSPEDVDVFLADKAPDAYERQVERLLASPHYGEKWGRQWLDAARYADSDGYEKDMTRNVTFYRDWVVNAFNRDLPYDQFIIQQIAGDLLAASNNIAAADATPQTQDPRSQTQDLIVATGFLRNSMLNEEGGVDPEQFRMEAMFDRMDAIGKSMLGLTIQCAQCHNHKFNPVSQEDYYKLFAFLNNDHEAQRVVYTPEQQMLAANLARQMRDLEEGLRHKTPGWEERMAKWEAEVTKNQPEWIIMRPVVEDVTTGGGRYLLQDDGSFIAQGYATTKGAPHFWLTNNLQNITAFRIELMTDANLPANGPGRSLKGVCALTEFIVNAIPAGSTNRTRLKFSSATADFEQVVTPLGAEHYDKTTNNRVVGPVTFASDNNENTAWGIDAGPGRRNRDRVAVFQCATNAGFAGGTVWDINVVQRHGGANSDDHQNNNLGRFRISVTTNAGPIVADSVPKRVRDILAIPREKRSLAQVATVFSHWRTVASGILPDVEPGILPGGKTPATADASKPSNARSATKRPVRAVERTPSTAVGTPAATSLFAEANQQIEDLWKQWPEGETQLTLQARAEPRKTHLLKRGEFLKPGNVVQTGVPGFLHQLPPGADGSRLTLARWLTDKKSPTTARSFVNRVWQSYFGTGLLESPEDFGTRAELPSHPELLDWLACEFMEGGIADGVLGLGSGVVNPELLASTTPDARRQTPSPWSVKHLHRLIVHSATYRQSSVITPDAYTRDPYNRLLARGPRFRVEGEIVRDIALASSGLLNPALGGRSVFPPAPEFLFVPPASYGPKDWPVDKGPERYRRSLYIFRFRSVPYPLLQTFDAPNGDFSCVRRLRSNTPLQALVSLNETTFMECAQALARKTLAEGGATDAARIDFAFRRALSRPPTESERAELLALLEKQKRYIGEGWVNATELATGQSEFTGKLPANITPTQLAAYTIVSRVLLNLDETITKE